MRRKLLATALLVLFGCHPVANAAPEVVIEKVVYAGAGCPAGSLDVAIDDADAELVLSYDKLVASAGPGVPVTETRKLCEAKSPSTSALREDASQCTVPRSAGTPNSTRT
ncbi:hypothetical protein GCM10022267_20950 [Lentzea roselyniae]|uniref:Uncharacterized protein n=1 Tax=Lentzea roselyniae TaxID=531940 RepID=A0ABP7AKJ4_9PSEU